MSIKNIYKSTIPSVNFVTTKGANLSFVEGRYITDNAREIAELDEVVKDKHPHIYVDADECKIDTEVVEALAAARAKAEADVLAAYADKTGVQVNADGTVVGAAPGTTGAISPASLVSAVTARSVVGKVGVAGSIAGQSPASVSQ